MEKKNGVHLYLNVKNLENIIAEEEEKDEDLKRTLHRLQTYFVGHTKLVKRYGAKIEKYTGGRSHIIIEFEDDSKIDYEKILELTVACFIYNNNLFNNLGKYSNYTNFQVHAGLDYGEYYEHDIVDNINTPEYTTIGGVANNSAKIQSYAPKDYIYITQQFLNLLPVELKDQFTELTEDEKEDFSKKIKGKHIYKGCYKDIFDEDSMEKIEGKLADVEERIKEESKDLNISDIIFEGATKKLSFDGLSLSGKNKRIEGGVLCADIRGFTKLFHLNDQNLDDLTDVIKEIYEIMGTVVNDSHGTKMQYQGDRIIAIYNDYSNEEDAILRMLKAALTLNSKVQELNEDFVIRKKLNNKKISVGIGCSFGNIIATRLGLNGNKHNIILSESYKQANKCEEKYSKSNEIVIWKYLNDLITENADKTESAQYLALDELFNAINKTGYYKTSATIEEYEEIVSQKEELENIASSVFDSNYQKNKDNQGKHVQIRPWGINL